MAIARTPRRGRDPRRGRPTRVMSHRARRQRAPSPDAIADRMAAVVGSAFQAWATRFIELVTRDLLPYRFRQDATLQGLYEEAGRAEPDRTQVEGAFRGLDRQSADEVRVAGVRTADVVPNVGSLQSEWLREHTDLIKAESDLRRRVERVLQDPLNEGRSVADITEMLKEQAGYSQSRAELTARDQTLKMYGRIQQARQQAAGITRYVWTTSLDERVRKDHALLDGSVQAWDAPPIVDQRTRRRAHPGGDFQCRCTAVPVLDEDDVQDPEVAQEQRASADRAVDEGRFHRPPLESAMRPSPAEVTAERQRVAAEAARERLEAEADRRIALVRERAQAANAAREAAMPPPVEVPPATALWTPAELIERAHVRARSMAARASIPAAVETAVAGKSLETLGALPFSAEELLTDASLRWLRASAYFHRTGNVEDNFGSSREGLPQITIDAAGAVYLSNGRHRLTVARERGLRQIYAHVRKFGARGGLLWDYVGLIRI